jgi:hypothetical protein
MGDDQRDGSEGTVCGFRYGIGGLREWDQGWRCWGIGMEVEEMGWGIREQVGK